MVNGYSDRTDAVAPRAVFRRDIQGETGRGFGNDSCLSWKSIRITTSKKNNRINPSDFIRIYPPGFWCRVGTSSHAAKRRQEAEIEKAVSSFMSRQNIPGLSVAIVQDNQSSISGRLG